jgi:hypothetical protein
MTRGIIENLARFLGMYRKKKSFRAATKSVCIVGAIWALSACQGPIGDRNLTDADVAFIRNEAKKIEKLCPHKEQPIRVTDGKHLAPRRVGILFACSPDAYPECVKRELRHLSGKSVRLHPMCFGGVE